MFEKGQKKTGGRAKGKKNIASTDLKIMILKDESMNNIPGQRTLPTMVENLGYESAVLKPKWERFCWDFVLSGADGKSAYKKIYPQAKDRTAQVNSSRLLTNATIIQRIQQV